MYGVWNSDSDANRRKARLELIEFLLQKNARVAAQPELMALAATLPSNPQLHLQVAQLFAQDQDYGNALSQYEQVLRTDRNNSHAMAGAGEAAFHLGKYRTAEEYLRMAVSARPEDTSSRQLLESATLILSTDPFVRRISDAERNRRVKEAWLKAGERLKSCAQAETDRPQLSTEQTSATQRPAAVQANVPSAPDSLAALQDQWDQMKPDILRLHSSAETDLPDAIMDLVFKIEQQTAIECGDPQGTDLALLLTSRNRDSADQ